MRVLLSIKPEYAEKVLNGTKRFEYRKAVPRNESVRTVVIYARMPVGKVIGEFEVGGVLCEKPEDLWKRTKEPWVSRASSSIRKPECSRARRVCSPSMIPCGPTSCASSSARSLGSRH